MGDGLAERLSGIYAELMDRVLDRGLPRKVFFMFEDVEGDEVYVGKARIGTCDDGANRYAEWTEIRPLQGESIRSYLNIIAREGRPAPLVCDETLSCAIMGGISNICQGENHIIACDEGFVRLYPGFESERNKLRSARIRRQEQAARGAQAAPTVRAAPEEGDYIMRLAYDLVQRIGTTKKLPQRLFLAVREDASQRIYGGTVEVSVEGKTQHFHLPDDYALIPHDPAGLADWLLENKPDTPMICSSSIADIIMESSEGSSDEFYRVAQRGKRMLEMYAPPSPPVSPDIPPVRDHIERIIRDTHYSMHVSAVLAQERGEEPFIGMPDSFYVIGLHPESGAYYGSLASVVPHGESFATNFAIPEAHPGLSACDLVDLVLEKRPGLPIMCDARDAEDICIIHQNYVSVDRHHRVLELPKGELDLLFPTDIYPGESR